MKPRTLLLLTAVTLWGLAAAPAVAADQAESPAPPAAVAPAPAPAAPLVVAEPAAPPAAVVPKVSGPRIGFVDMERISTESAMGKASQSAVTAEQQKMQKEIDGRKAKLEKQQAELEKKLPTLQPAQREAKIKEFQKKVEEMQRFGRNGEKQLVALREKLTKELLDAIEKAGKSIGQASKLTAVVVKGNVLYLDADAQVQEITDEVVKLLDAEGEKK
jgi:outer membrane protein